MGYRREGADKGGENGVELSPDDCAVPIILKYVLHV